MREGCVRFNSRSLCIAGERIQWVDIMKARSSVDGLRKRLRELGIYVRFTRKSPHNLEYNALIKSRKSKDGFKDSNGRIFRSLSFTFTQYNDDISINTFNPNT